MDDKRPKIGVGVIIKKDNKVFIGNRINSHGHNTWSFPGGHLEFGESVSDCAKREVAEEIGIKIKNLKVGPYTEDYFEKEDKHYITLFVICDYSSGEAKNLEPHKCKEWKLVEWNKMPKNLFTPIKNLKIKKFNPFNIK